MAASHRKSTPLPNAQAFVVCREILEDSHKREFVLIGPLSVIVAGAFPFLARLSIYAHLTCGHSDYDVALRLIDNEDRALWEWKAPQAIRLLNPLDQHRLVLYDAELPFSMPGRHDLLLLANGEELARHALHVVTPVKPE